MRTAEVVVGQPEGVPVPEVADCIVLGTDRDGFGTDCTGRREKLLEVGCIVCWHKDL